MRRDDDWTTPVPLRGQTIPLHSTGVVKGQTVPYEGWTMTSTDAAPAPVVVVRRSGTIARMITVLTVGSRYTHPRISRTWSATGGYVYTISNAGVVRTCGWTLGAVHRGLIRVTIADGAVAPSRGESTCGFGDRRP